MKLVRKETHYKTAAGEFSCLLCDNALFGSSRDCSSTLCVPQQHVDGNHRKKKVKLVLVVDFPKHDLKRQIVLQRCTITVLKYYFLL